MPEAGVTSHPTAPAATDRARLARMLRRLFDRWGLDNAERLALLGLSSNHRGLLSKYRAGSRALPASPDVLDRAGYLLAIHRGLGLLYPHSPELRDGWVKLRNSRVDGQTPRTMMQTNQIGLARVARVVDWECGHWVSLLDTSRELDADIFRGIVARLALVA